MKRSKLITKIIVFAVIIYAGISLIAFRGRIEAGQQELDGVKKRIAEVEISNAEKEYINEQIKDIDNNIYDIDPDVIENIARARLGYVSQGEIVFLDGSNVQDDAG